MASATCNRLLCGTTDGNDPLSWMLPCVKPCYVRIWHLVETSNRLRREVCVAHFVQERPFARCDKDRTVHGMAGLTEINDPAGAKWHHIDARVCTAPGLAERLIQVRGVLARRDPNPGAVLLGVER